MKFTWLDLMRAIWFLLGNKRKRYLTLTAILFMAQFYWVIPPLVIAKIVDFFTNYKPGDSLSPFYSYAVFLGVLQITVSMVRLITKKHMGNLRTDVIYNIRVKGFEKLSTLSLLDNDNESSGERAQRIQNGADVFQSFAKMFDNEVMVALTSTIGIAVVFLFLSPEFILLLALYIIGFFVIVAIFYRKLQKINNQLSLSLEKASGSYVEGLNNLLTIKALGAENSFRTHISSKENIRRSHEYRLREVGNNQWKIFHVLNSLYTGIFLFLVGKNVLSGAISVGSIVIFMSYLDRLASSSAQIMVIYEDLLRAKANIGRMMPIFKIGTENRGRLGFPKKWNSIQIKDGNFKYRPSIDEANKKQKRISSADIKGLNNINLRIIRNQMIGIVGKTGSGKSTLAKILIGLYRLENGSYKIGKRDFHLINQERVIENITLVPQESEMFNLPLRENITMMHEVNAATLDKAIAVAQLEEVIMRMPAGLNTLIGEKGYRLSGGERQRVGIARAFCRPAEIIIFDEATSSLDNRTEQLIQEGLKRELRNKTLILIAHRTSTLKEADEIYVLDKGTIVEEGTYCELVENPDSIFTKFYNK